jgi:hypothetical protein
MKRSDQKFKQTALALTLALLLVPVVTQAKDGTCESMANWAKGTAARRDSGQSLKDTNKEIDSVVSAGGAGSNSGKKKALRDLRDFVKAQALVIYTMDAPNCCQNQNPDQIYMLYLRECEAGQATSGE